jgi:hypothetical protein
MLAALVNGVKGGKWPNAFFASKGLFTMEVKKAKAMEESRSLFDGI